MTGFVLDLATFRPGMDRTEEEAAASDVGLLQPEWREQVRGTFVIEQSGARVTVRGSVQSRAHLECVRCLREFDLPLEVPMVIYAERTGSTSREEQDQLERDDHMLFHDGRRLDLREAVREALLLELPITPYCREDCPGLCPSCGAELSLGPCGCTPQADD
ncbi:MAG: DUF177 domain-containing protein [Candidatus Eisenbacteria bacterium]|nr:DUF177 domain-containing protein [Candidatus Eisenbacteria bacterium]